MIIHFLWTKIHPTLNNKPVMRKMWSFTWWKYSRNVRFAIASCNNHIRDVINVGSFSWRRSEYNDRNVELSPHQFFSEPTLLTSLKRLLHGATANLTQCKMSWENVKEHSHIYRSCRLTIILNKLPWEHFRHNYLSGWWLLYPIDWIFVWIFIYKFVLYLFQLYIN